MKQTTTAATRFSGWRLLGRLFWPLVALLLAPAMTLGAPPDGNTLVKVKLVAAEKALVPGRETQIGLVFDIEPEWHIYWRNQGDSGAPTSFKFKTPSGVTIGEAQWPTPMRHVELGDLVDFTYENRVMLIFPLRVDASAAVGSSVTISVDAAWMVCRELCVGGEGSATITLPVAADGGGTNESKLFEEFRARVPRAMEGSGVSAAWSERTLVIEAPGASAITWFPYEYDIVSEGPVNVLRDTAGSGATLRVEYGSTVGNVKMIRGVAEVRRAEGVKCVLIEVPPPGKK